MPVSPLMRDKENKECMICFDDLDDEYIECPDHRCECKLCFNCSYEYIKSCYPSTIPQCPLPSCEFNIMFSEVCKLGNKPAKKYLKEVYNTLNGKDVEKLEAKANIVDTIRQKRAKYMKEKFPPLIALTIEVCMKDKLKELDNKIKRQTEDRAKNGVKKCFSVLCSGYLDEYLVCADCEKCWCDKCEQEKKGHSHVCKEEDLESVKMLKTLIECPNCKVKVVKSLGCNSMTCAVCKTQFDYVTGEIGGHGSEKVRYVSVKEGTIEKLTSDPAIQKMFYLLAKKKPKKLKMGITHQFILDNKDKFKKKGEKYSWMKKLAQKYEKVEVNKIKARDFNRMMSTYEGFARMSERDECKKVYNLFKSSTDDDFDIPDSEEKEKSEESKNKKKKRKKYKEEK